MNARTDDTAFNLVFPVLRVFRLFRALLWVQEFRAVREDLGTAA